MRIDNKASQPRLGQPAAYQKGLADFYGREFVVTPDVLIPRPETEAIIDMVLNLLGKPYLPGVKPGEAKLPRKVRVVDVGTGSGCIAITLKLEAPELSIVATDVSRKALDIAKRNMKLHGADIDLRQSDLLSDIDYVPELVIANLPYVNKEWDWIDKKALSYEPELALYADNHGLGLIFRLIDQAKEKDVKHLILEADLCQHDEISKYAKSKEYLLSEERGFSLYYTNSLASTTKISNRGQLLELLL